MEFRTLTIVGDVVPLRVANSVTAGRCPPFSRSCGCLCGGQNLSSAWKEAYFAGAIFLTLAASLQPFYNAAGAYSQTGLDNLAGAQTPAFNSSFGKSISECVWLLHLARLTVPKRFF